MYGTKANKISTLKMKKYPKPLETGFDNTKLYVLIFE